jgi:protein-tyrosine phosphatase
MAEGIFRKLLRERGLERSFAVDSAGTGGWHAGQGADARTVIVLERHGANFHHVAREIRAEDASVDLILAADRSNLRDLERRLPEAGSKLGLMLGDRELPDPYYGGLSDFERTYEWLEVRLREVLSELTNG